MRHIGLLNLNNTIENVLGNVLFVCDFTANDTKPEVDSFGYAYKEGNRYINDTGGKKV